MTLKLFVFFLLAGFTAVFFSHAFGAEEAPRPVLEPVSLQLKWFHQFQFAGYYAAKEQGYYAAEGLDVEIRELSPGKNPVTQVLAREADFAVGDSGIIAAYANGAAITALAAIFQHDPLVFISKRSSGIVSPYEMAGKRIMFNAEGADDAPLRAMLADAGVGQDNFVYVKHTFDNDDLTRNKVDVMSAYLTDEPFYFEKQNVELNIINPQNYGFDFYGDILFTSRREIAEHPGRAERFRRATLQGWRYALEHPDQLVNLIHKRYHSRLGIEHLRHEAEQVRKLILAGSVPLGQIQAGRLRRVAKIYADLNIAPRLSDSQLDSFLYDHQAQLDLSAEEQAWLQQHPVIRVGIDRDFAPYEWIDKQGRYVGMTADYLRLIEQRLKVHFDIVKDKTWPEILEMAKRGEVDILSDAVKTPERERYLRFTQPYFHHPIIIITANSRGYVGNLEHLKGKLVAIEKGYFMEEMLTREHPEIQLIAFNGVRPALQATAAGKADAYIGHAATAGYTIKQEAMLQLSFAGETGYYGDHSIAVLKNNPLLHSILEKALANITEQERNNIQNYWMNLKIERGLPLQTLLQYAAAVLTLLLLFTYWIYRLRLEIGARCASETALRESEAKLQAILETEPECVKIISADGRLMYMNRAGLKMIEAEDDPSQVLGKKAGAFVVPEDLQAVEEMHKRVLQTGQECTLEFRLQGLKGTHRYLESHAIPFRDTATQTLSVLSVTRDITERKLADLQLQQSEAKFRAIIEASPVPYALNDTQNIIFVNRAFIETFGYTLDDIPTLGEWGPKAYPDPDYRRWIAEAWQMRLEQAAKNGGSFEPLELHIHCKDGRLRNAMVSAAALGESFAGVHLVILYDITELANTGKALAESNALLETVIATVPQHFWTARPEGNVDYVSQRALDYFGCNLETIIEDGWQRFLHQEDSAECFKLWSEALHTGKPYEYTARLRHYSGEYRWHIARALPLKNESGQIVKWYGTNTDISELKKNEEKLTLAARVFSEAHEAIVITDADGIIVDVNPTYCEITGYSRAEVIGKNPNILKSGKQSTEFYAAMWKTLLEAGHWRGEVWNRRKNGELFPELLTISALRDAGGKIVNFIGLFSDITQIKHQQQALELMAHYDPLTQLPNRVLFADRFKQAVARSKRDKTLLGICYLDLDGFKPVNDNYGHETGDVLLIEVAERIKNCLRDEDTVSRLGGDEFALLLVDLHSSEQLEMVLARLHDDIAQPFRLDNGEQAEVTASTGVTLFPLDDGDPDTLLRHADQAMYQAKLAGRNCYRLFDPAQDQRLHSRGKSLNLIEQALSNHQFCLYYQPKVDMRSVRVVGAEALIRWNHPERGVLLPGEFLPLIEGTALETALGDWVIETAFQQLEAWQKIGLELQISVNIAPGHLQRKSFIKDLAAALERHPSIDSRLLELEVLESSVLVDLVAASNTLKECYHTLGVPFALDDFGTGYSSLTHLRRLPVTTIKIDQCFVRDMLEDIDDLAIVESVVGLAQAFKRNVIAEGVESMEHGLALLNIGCSIVQGYAVAAPMPASAVADWVRRYHPYSEWSAFAHNPPTPQQAQLLLMQIEVDQLVKHIGEQLRESSGVRQHWPMMNPKKSYLSNWVLQAEKDKCFDRTLLDELLYDHSELLRISEHLKQLYQDGKAAVALAEFGELTAVQRRINDLIAAFDQRRQAA